MILQMVLPRIGHQCEPVRRVSGRKHGFHNHFAGRVFGGGSIGIHIARFPFAVRELPTKGS